MPPLSVVIMCAIGLLGIGLVVWAAIADEAEAHALAEVARLRADDSEIVGMPTLPPAMDPDLIWPLSPEHGD